MDCSTARELLSAFHDHELGPESEAEVRKHVEACLSCSAALADFNALSRMVGHLRDPLVPPNIWPVLEARLQSGRTSADRRHIRRRLVTIAIAASLIVAASIGLVAYFAQSSGYQQHVAAAGLARFLEEFDHNPDRAQNQLLASYNGRAVNLAQAARLARYRPVAPGNLPGGFSRSGTYVLEMPCCTCVETVYKDGDGQVVAVFEHENDESLWIGGRPTITAICNGRPTRLIQVDGHFTATWKSNGRQITVVGARGVEQLPRLMAALDNVKLPNGSESAAVQGRQFWLRKERQDATPSET